MFLKETFLPSIRFEDASSEWKINVQTQEIQKYSEHQVECISFGILH